MDLQIPVRLPSPQKEQLKPEIAPLSADWAQGPANQPEEEEEEEEPSINTWFKLPPFLSLSEHMKTMTWENEWFR